MKRRKVLMMSALFLSGLAIAIFLNLGNFSQLNEGNIKQSASALAQTVKSEIPPSIMPCLPRGKRIKSFKLETMTEYQGKEYYLVTVAEEVDTIFENDVELLLQKT
jgi:hypothetical protein